MRRPHTFSPLTVEAGRLLGARIKLARVERRWTLQELADRIGVTHTTMRKVERGDLSVGLGVAFEAATIVGVTLFDDDQTRRSVELGRVADRLALLPKATRKSVTINDDF